MYAKKYDRLFSITFRGFVFFFLTLTIFENKVRKPNVYKLDYRIFLGVKTGKELIFEIRKSYCPDAWRLRKNKRNTQDVKVISSSKLGGYRKPVTNKSVRNSTIKIRNGCVN